MYFTSLPDHSKPGFNEHAHFGKFKKHNIIFNALSSNSHCDNHTGCLSFKTVLHGEEWYGFNNHHIAIRPGQFLILNDDQTYSCRIEGEKVRSLSIFFKKEFASSILHDSIHNEQNLLDDPFRNGEQTPEFFQSLHNIDSPLQMQLSSFVALLNREGYDNFIADEYLVYLLHHLIRVHHSDRMHTRDVKAVRAKTRNEIYKRLSIAKDILYSNYMEKMDLTMISTAACLSIPQLVRQFKSVFHITPHQYLIQIRLQHATELLKHTTMSVNEITWKCGFENTSAFCRSFKSEYGVQPGNFRNNLK